MLNKSEVRQIVDSLSGFRTHTDMVEKQACGFEARKHGVPVMGHNIFTSDEPSSEPPHEDARGCRG